MIKKNKSKNIKLHFVLIECEHMVSEVEFKSYPLWAPLCHSIFLLFPQRVFIFIYHMFINQSNLEVRPIVRPKLESMQAALHFAHACSCWHAHACLCLTLLQLRVLNRIITSIIIKQYSSIKVLVLSGRANDLVNWNSRRTSSAGQGIKKIFFFLKNGANIKSFFLCSISRSRNWWWWKYATTYRFGAATNSLSCSIRDRGLGIRQNIVVVIWRKNGVLWSKNLLHVPSYPEL